MANDINYQALANEGNPFIEKSSHDHEAGIEETTTDTEYEDGHRDVMIHVVPDTSKGNNNTFHRSRFHFFCNLFVCLFINLSAMESHRRFGLVFHTNVSLPSKTWFHNYDDGPFT